MCGVLDLAGGPLGFSEEAGSGWGMVISWERSSQGGGWDQAACLEEE